MINLKINIAQEQFLKCAVNIKDCILDFEIDDKEFKESHGFSKKVMIREIENLREMLK